MKNMTKFFIFILDELIFVFLIIAIMWYLRISIEIFLIVLSVIVIGLAFISYVFLPQLKKPVTGYEGLIGEKGEALESFDKKGSILVHGERWNAMVNEGYVKKGDDVIIQDVKGLTLFVKKR